jgi:hypothetical protein
MKGTAMRKTLLQTLLLSLLLASTAYSQSLGDVARQEREKRDDPSQTAPKVFTNEDLPTDGGISSIGSRTPEPTPAAHPMGSGSAEHWKFEIAQQKRVVQDLQDRIARLNSSVRFATGYSCYHCAQYNERQLQKQDQVQTMQQQLEEQRRRLEQMQEEARKQGFGNAVYEP